MIQSVLMLFAPAVRTAAIAFAAPTQHQKMASRPAPVPVHFWRQRAAFGLVVLVNALGLLLFLAGLGLVLRLAEVLLS